MKEVVRVNKERSKEIRVLIHAINDLGVNYTAISKVSGISKTSMSKFINGVFDYSDYKLDMIDEGLEKYKALL